MDEISLRHFRSQFYDVSGVVFENERLDAKSDVESVGSKKNDGGTENSVRVGKAFGSWRERRKQGRPRN